MIYEHSEEPREHVPRRRDRRRDRASRAVTAGSSVSAVGLLAVVLVQINALRDDMREDVHAVRARTALIEVTAHAARVELAERISQLEAEVRMLKARE